ncbi:sporulation histidine kinase inhibitor Sda [Paenibacillus turpanensis]|nr:sporulation histidine kinase inhibitor Sda [Paenibacillus turpanensis]
MRLLSNESLLDTYYKAVELKLEKDFINMLLDEIRRRNLKLSKHSIGA